MMFPVHMMPDNIDPVKYFEKLSKWEEFYRKGDIHKKNKTFRWIAYMYDKESPFREKIQDANKRKVEIARYVKMFSDPKIVEEWVMKILNGTNPDVNTMVIAYIRMHRHPKYALTVGLENQFYSSLEKVSSGSNQKIALTSIQQDLENAMTELLNGDHNPNMHNALFAYMEEERLANFSPEGVAMAIESGTDIFEGEEPDYGDD